MALPTLVTSCHRLESTLIRVQKASWLQHRTRCYRESRGVAARGWGEGWELRRERREAYIVRGWGMVGRDDKSWWVRKQRIKVEIKLNIQRQVRVLTKVRRKGDGECGTSSLLIFSPKGATNYWLMEKQNRSTFYRMKVNPTRITGIRGWQRWELGSKGDLHIVYPSVHIYFLTTYWTCVSFLKQSM